MIKFIYIVLFLLTITGLAARENDTINFLSRDFHLAISYYGHNIIKPGIKFSIDYVAKSGKSEKITKKGVNNKFINQFCINGNTGFIFFERSHYGFFNYYQAVYRKIRLNKSKYSSISVGPGFYNSLYSETYEVDENGNVNDINISGRTYFSTVATLGTGRMITGKIFSSWFINTDFMFLFDYNAGVVPYINVEFGMSFN